MDKMRKMALMRYAASLGVPTRQERSKAWRVVRDVREDCKVRLAAQQQLPGAPARESASASVAVPLASNELEPAQSLSAHTVEPSSASSSQAAVAPSASGRAAASVECDMGDMRQNDLRKLAASLGVQTRANKKNVASLRSVCTSALHGQTSITGFFKPAVVSQGNLGTDSQSLTVSSNLEPRRATGLKPMWMRKNTSGNRSLAEANVEIRLGTGSATSCETRSGTNCRSGSCETRSVTSCSIGSCGISCAT